MAVTITDNRSLVDHADATTGWSSPVAGESITQFTSEPNPVELSGCLGIVVSTQTSELLHTHSSTDLSAGVLVYFWAFPRGAMDTVANGGIQGMLGDGTNTIGFNVAGSDKDSFAHEEGPVGWQCLILDTGNLPAGTTDARGTAASLDDTVITEFGVQFKTLAKSVGGADNCFVDTIRYGNGGLDILGGTSGDRGTFLEIATEDRDTTSGKAYGILRELGTGLYGCQGALTFGETGTATHYFQDKDGVVNWETRGQASGRFNLTLQSNATGVGHFQLGLISGTENGTNGYTLIQPTGSGCTFDASAAAFDSVLLYDTTLKNWTGTVDFCDDATNGITHDVFDCLFDTCGTVNPGRVDMKNCSFVNSSATEAFILDDTDNTLLENLSFTSDGTGHAIHVIPAGAGPHSFTFTNFSYTGYAGSDGSTGNECILVDSATDQDITITLSGGDTPSIMEAAGYTGVFTLVTSSATTTVTVLDARDNSVIENARVLVTAGAVGNEPFEDSVTITRVTTTASVAHTAHGLSTGEKVLIKGAVQQEYNGVKTISNVTVNAYDFTVAGSPTTPATGTIIATGVIIDGLTNVSGIISDTRSFGANQSIGGIVRKSSATPYFRSSPELAGTINTTSGLSLTVQLVLDE